MDMMKNEEMLAKWIEWVDIIHQNIEDLLVSQHIYKAYLEIVKRNPEIQSPIDFHDWVRKNYASAVAIHIRRELDTGSDVISLKRLLMQIQKNPQVITRDWFRSLYKGSNADDFADGDFEEVAGKGETFDSAIAKQDIEKLEQLGKYIEDYATLRIAHSSKKPLTKDPTYDDLDAFIKEYENIVKKYILLFTASGYTSLTPTWQYDWEEIFTKPWIKQKP